MPENRAKKYNSNMKKLFLLVLLSLGLTPVSYGISYGNFLDDWTNNQLCGWMDKPSPPAYMVTEVKKRGISCEGGVEVEPIVVEVKVVIVEEVVEIVTSSDEVEVIVVEVVKEEVEEVTVVTSSDEDLSLGISAAKEGDYNSAIDFLSSSIKKNPNNAVAYYFLGKSLHKLGLDYASEQSYRKALELNERYPEVHYSLGVLYTSQGNYRKAIDSYTMAISFNQNYSSPYLNRGVIYYNQGSHQKALFDFTRALEIEPKSSLALINRANVYSAMGAKEAVCEDLQKLCSLGNCASLNNLKSNGYCKN